MEPRQQGRQGGGEQFPIQGGERSIGATPEVPLNQPEAGRELYPAAGELNTQVAQTPIPVLPTPVVASPTPALPATDDDVPITANDDDLIEKEWVDKVKQVIAETKDDPYARERAISKLQIEYIRRRYGREIGETSD